MSLTYPDPEAEAPSQDDHARVRHVNGILELPYA